MPCLHEKNTLKWSGLLALILLTWFSGSAALKVDSSIDAIPIFNLSDLKEQWQTTLTDGGTHGTLAITEVGVTLNLPADSVRSVDTGQGLAVAGHRHVGVHASLPNSLSPPFPGALLLASATVSRASGVQFTVAQNEKPLVYVGLHDGQSIVDYALIHRSTGILEREATTNLFKPEVTVDELRIGWQITEVGVWQLDALSLAWVAPSPHYNKIILVLGLLWVSAALMTLWPVIRGLRWQSTLLGAVMLALMLIGVLAAKPVLGQVLSYLQSATVGWWPQHVSPDARLIQKAGHFAAFTGIAALVFAQWHRLNLSAWRVCWGLFLLACATEALQRHIPQRHPSIHDVLIDMLGVSAGFVCFHVACRLVSCHRHYKTPSVPANWN